MPAIIRKHGLSIVWFGMFTGKSVIGCTRKDHRSHRNSMGKPSRAVLRP
ncbi:MAG TPA: hypothetical protein PKL48_15455 [Thermodesulfobacteriota bacterium]|nr:hypothetical protein [Deltaproteobacteria bacterium]HNU73096.1 hypothetical protein [Thermodesulfobacteriota bacterium]